MCEPPYLLEVGNCVLECQIKGNQPNKKRDKCVDQTMFPVIGPIYSIFSAIVVIVVMIVKAYERLHGSRKTVFVSSVIGMVGCIETVAIWFNF